VIDKLMNKYKFFWVN